LLLARSLESAPVDIPIIGRLKQQQEQENAMATSGMPQDHLHHHHDADGPRVMPGGTVMKGAVRDHHAHLLLSFAYNVAGVPLAADVLYPFFGLLLSPVVPAAAMALSSVSVIANALRLRTVNVE
jgi:hypothetical protein